MNDVLLLGDSIRLRYRGAVQEGVEFLDLYTPVKQRLEERICDDLVHLTPVGIEVCAKEVAENLMRSP